MAQSSTESDAYSNESGIRQKLSALITTLEEASLPSSNELVKHGAEELVSLLGCSSGAFVFRHAETVIASHSIAMDASYGSACEKYQFASGQYCLELVVPQSHVYDGLREVLDDFLQKFYLLCKATQGQSTAIAASKEMQRFRLSIESAFNSLPDGIVIFSRAFTISYANKTFLRQVGKTFDSVCNKTLEECMGTVGMPFLSVCKQTMELGRPTNHFRTSLMTLHGEKRKFEVNAAPIGDNEFSVDGVILIIRDITRLVALEENLNPHYECGNMIGESKAFQRVAAVINRLRETDTTVLVTGESGTGKELVAEALHFNSHRTGKPLIKVNCSALSETLLESELFGHVKGAFTGAVKDADGRIRAAEGGTLFLDEIGDISPQVQIKLLRFLENKEYERVGCTDTLKANVRVVTATNADLIAKVQDGAFREDLYYRLNVFPIVLPPLRDRKEDIPLLAQHFLEYFNIEFGRSVFSICPECMRSLIAYSWPGNIRELRHVIEYAFVLCTGSTLNASHFPLNIMEHRAKEPVGQPVPVQPVPVGTEDTAGQFDSKRVAEALEAAGGKKAKAARALGVSRTTLYRWLQKMESAP